MLRFLLLLALTLALAMPRLAHAQEGVLSKDDGPPIAITSPDTGSTFAMGSLKTRSLYWSKQQQMLIARVVYTDADLLNNNSPQDDTLEFRLPGITFDEAKGIFSAKTAKGEVIPIARIKKTLFMKTIEVLPNANVRVIKHRSDVSVILEAISPNDPAMHPAPINPDGEHKVDIRQILN